MSGHKECEIKFIFFSFYMRVLHLYVLLLRHGNPQGGRLVLIVAHATSMLYLDCNFSIIILFWIVPRTFLVSVSESSVQNKVDSICHFRSIAANIDFLFCPSNFPSFLLELNVLLVVCLHRVFIATARLCCYQICNYL